MLIQLNSGSHDGYVKWWDIRSLEKPLQEMLIGGDNYKGPEGFPSSKEAMADVITALEFEPTIPMRFMIGTNQVCYFLSLFIQYSENNGIK